MSGAEIRPRGDGNLVAEKGQLVPACLFGQLSQQRAGAMKQQAAAQRGERRFGI
jgi:hypothetical protein